MEPGVGGVDAGSFDDHVVRWTSPALDEADRRACGARRETLHPGRRGLRDLIEAIPILALSSP
ncbi:MAG: hypothetical protein HY909_25915 [Deltaproteobacteria bacterium]|nr:hypothetical protein [Deltaproteobacteria bacterium]